MNDWGKQPPGPRLDKAKTLILKALSGGDLSAPDIRTKLGRAEVRIAKTRFYKLMKDLEDDGVVERFGNTETDNGTRFRLTS